MTPLMVKGTLFGLLLLSAAVWDMRNREIPNLIPALLLLCGLIGFRPAAYDAEVLTPASGRRPFPAGGGPDKTGRVCHRRR